MNRHPAPVSTASAASTIWSGVGEVNTWPGQAASSMPQPDEAGMQRLVARSAARDQRDLARRQVSGAARTLPPRRGRRCPRERRRSPSRLSERIVSMSLMNFFMASSPFVFWRFNRAGSGRGAAPFLPSGLRARGCASSSPRSGTSMADAPRRRTVRDGDRPARMGGVVGVEKGLPLRRREVTDLEDHRQVLRRHRHRIGGIGDLRR